MANVLILTTATGTDPRRPYDRREFEFLSRAAHSDRFKVHRLTEVPDEAELILFAGAGQPGFLDVRRHDYVRRMRERCFLVDSGDEVIPFLPGVYTSIERRWFSETRTRSGCYLRVFTNRAIDNFPDYSQCDLLFSFLGTFRNARVRKRLGNLRHAGGLIFDTNNGRGQAPMPYVDSLRRSQFVLCPRGFGPSSWRLFEAMKAGRVPVILSDQWVPPRGPQWSDFSVRVPERSVDRIPMMLEELAGSAERMGARARQNWEQWFSEETAFHRIVEWCLEMKRLRRVPEWIGRLPAYCQLLRPYHFRHTLVAGLKSQLRARLAPRPNSPDVGIDPRP